MNRLDVRRLLRTASLTFAVACASQSGMSAHEIGTTRVTAHVTSSDYTIDVLQDPASLLARLESLAGRPRSGAVPDREYRIRIETLQREFLSQVDIRFDNISSPPRFEYRQPAPSSADEQPGAGLATIRLTGRVPAGARQFTWKYGLTSAAYAFVATRDAPAPGPVEWLEGAQVSRPFSVAASSAAVSRAEIAWTYLLLGFTHIVPKGIDHILFVLGLFLFSRQFRPLLLQVTAFTVAHSISLALSMFGVVRLAPAVVEPLIALSIAYVAIENIFTSRLGRWRIVLVFSFGLLHGLGFAGVLNELGLPRTAFVTALLTFNLGVEFGQLIVIAIAFGIVAHWAGRGEWYRRHVVVPASALIALVGVYWTAQRIL